jgi:hypothetical protein
VRLFYPGAGAGAPLMALLLFLLIAMPLDGVEHAHAQHENLERKEDDREPVPHIGCLHVLTGALLIVRDLYRKTAAS